MAISKSNVSHPPSAVRILLAIRDPRIFVRIFVDLTAFAGPLPFCFLLPPAPLPAAPEFGPCLCAKSTCIAYAERLLAAGT
jgi:hypothetical protein